MERVDVAIVGGGPAGSAAAHAAATGGADALVLEKGVPRADRDRLGPDSTDAAGILDYWVDIMGIHPDEFDDGVVQRELNRAEFRGPDESATLTSTGIDSSYDKFGYTFHRARFDDWLRDRAEDAGAEYRAGVSVRGVDTDSTISPEHDDPRHVVELASGESVGAEFVVLADGPQRTVTNRVLDEYLPADAAASDRLASRTANHIAYQEYRRVPEEVYEEVNDALVFWWGVMPGETAYPWIFPNADRVCRIGLTMPIGLDIDEFDRDAYALLDADDESIPQGGEYVRRLLEWQYGDEYDVEEEFPLVEDAGKRNGTETYPISSTRPIDSPTEVGVAVAGGAMGTTSAFHEGGDHVAVRTGKIAGRLAAEESLERYNREWQAAIGDEVLRNVTFADLVRDWSPRDWDRAFDTANSLMDARGIKADAALRGGLHGLQLVARYKYGKYGYRGGRYVQLREADYAI